MAAVLVEQAGLLASERQEAPVKVEGGPGDRVLHLEGSEVKCIPRRDVAGPRPPWTIVAQAYLAAAVHRREPEEAVGVHPEADCTSWVSEHRLNQ